MQQTNFAIWYTYYRVRIAMIKSAASLAFTPLTDSFRVGLITVNPKYPNNVPLTADSLNAPINPAKYLPIADFDSTQRTAWFSKLFSQKTGGTSPSREGLARVGRHYAGKTDGINTGMPEDPVQYSCQQNFTIMTTDGYWNDNAETVGAGPVRIDGVTPVGQQDGNLDALTTNTDAGIINVNGTPRPIWDGVPDGKRVRTNKSNSYTYSPCGVYFNKTEIQVNRATTQISITTSQTTRSTMQSLQSTSQVLMTSAQNLQSTSQMAREHGAEPAEHQPEPAEHEPQPAEHDADAAEHGAEPAQHEPESAEHVAEPAGHVADGRLPLVERARRSRSTARARRR